VESDAPMVQMRGSAECLIGDQRAGLNGRCRSSRRQVGSRRFCLRRRCLWD